MCHDDIDIDPCSSSFLPQRPAFDFMEWYPGQPTSGPGSKSLVFAECVHVV